MERGFRVRGTEEVFYSADSADDRNFNRGSCFRRSRGRLGRSDPRCRRGGGHTFYRHLVYRLTFPRGHGPGADRLALLHAGRTRLYGRGCV